MPFALVQIVSPQGFVPIVQCERMGHLRAVYMQGLRPVDLLFLVGIRWFLQGLSVRSHERESLKMSKPN